MNTTISPETQAVYAAILREHQAKCDYAMELEKPFDRNGKSVRFHYFRATIPLGETPRDGLLRHYQQEIDGKWVDMLPTAE